MVIVLCSIARCIIFGVTRLPVRPCDERPPAMHGHFCLVPRVSVHDRYYCIHFSNLHLKNQKKLIFYLFSISLTNCDMYACNSFSI